MRSITILCGAICGLFLADAGATALHLPTPLSVQTAEAQQMSKQPWSPTARNRSLSAQFQHSDRQLRETSGGDGMGALQQFVETYNHTYNSSSTSIGNLNEISQILSDGSTGNVQQATDQDSQGNQGSAANTEAAVDSQTSSTSSAATNTNGGDDDNTDGGDDDNTDDGTGAN
ncbi:hypothetical protein [Fodinicurvata sp. EGI_FJ10296]|uniref:hypothetical protein n=1 Tax=Fodinicurvata sp. EGI_FJ10296 TaxID=3231908 RepID=UPI003456B2DD